jgi:glycosyltransferase involved in cell wall biosynthesis
MNRFYFIIPHFGDTKTGGTLYDLNISLHLRNKFLCPINKMVSYKISIIKLARLINTIPKGSTILLDGFIANKIKHHINLKNKVNLLIHLPCSLEHSTNKFFNMKKYFDERRSFNRANKIITVSNYMKKEISKYLNNNKKIFVAKPGIDEKFFIHAKNKANSNLLSIGNVIPRKGYIYLIKALKEVDRNWHLNIIGSTEIDKEYFSELEGLIKQLKLEDKISFLGTLSGEEIVKYIKISRIFVLPTIYESFGMSILECSIAGMKIITTDLPVLREVLKGKHATFVKKNEINSLSDAIKDNLNYDKDINENIYDKSKYSWSVPARIIKKAINEF